MIVLALEMLLAVTNIVGVKRRMTKGWRLLPVAGCTEDSDDDSNSDKRLNVFVDVAVATDMPIAGRVEIPSTLPSDRLIAARLTLLQ